MVDINALALRLGQVWASARKTPSDNIKLVPRANGRVALVHYWGSFESTTVFMLGFENNRYWIRFRGHALFPTIVFEFDNPAILFSLLRDKGMMERVTMESSDIEGIKSKYAAMFAMYEDPESVETMLMEMGEL